mmetsp:Transcript_11473/g.29322  ORF Transcript_11473/g.29322 Transcript_11473/m.29322 type:complete len:212 (-) Transcript_11473:1139-1774(-)
MAPPQLPRDAPLSDILEPVVPDLLVVFWYNLQPPLPDGIDGLCRHVGAVAKPLRDSEWLDDVLRSRTDRDYHRIVLLASEKTKSGQFLLDRNTSIVPLHSGEFTTAWADESGLVNNGDKRQIVPFATLPIVWIVRRSDLHGASSEGYVDHGVCDDNKLSVRNEGVCQCLANKLCVPGIVWVHCYGRVTQHRLETRCGDNNFVVTAIDLVRK